MGYNQEEKELGMNRLILLMCVVLITLQSHSSGMYEEASKVGINNNCLSQLKMLTDVLQPIGVNLVSYKIEDPSKSPSYHFGQQKKGWINNIYSVT